MVVKLIVWWPKVANFYSRISKCSLGHFFLHGCTTLHFNKVCTLIFSIGQFSYRNKMDFQLALERALAPDCVALVDAIASPDFALASALGSSDGRWNVLILPRSRLAAHQHNRALSFSRAFSLVKPPGVRPVTEPANVRLRDRISIILVSFRAYENIVADLMTHQPDRAPFAEDLMRTIESNKAKPKL